MSQNSLVEYISRLRNRYARMTGKLGRSRQLDEFCEVSGFERKYAMKVLAGSGVVAAALGVEERRGSIRLGLWRC